jgi:hypothetical protein
LQTCQSITLALITDCGNPTPEIAWQNTIGGKWIMITYQSIRQTADGGYILGGSSNGQVFQVIKHKPIKEGLRLLDCKTKCRLGRYKLKELLVEVEMIT